jgi:hypothetical protein
LYEYLSWAQTQVEQAGKNAAERERLLRHQSQQQQEASTNQQELAKLEDLLDAL